MKVYCIRHEEMVWVEKTPISEGHTVFTRVATPFPFDFSEIDFCDFPDGFAYCPPPEFDMDLYVESVYPLDEMHADRLPGRDYDFENDEIVMEELS